MPLQTLPPESARLARKRKYGFAAVIGCGLLFTLGGLLYAHLRGIPILQDTANGYVSYFRNAFLQLILGSLLWVGLLSPCGWHLTNTLFKKRILNTIRHAKFCGRNAQKRAYWSATPERQIALYHRSCEWGVTMLLPLYVGSVILPFLISVAFVECDSHNFSPSREVFVLSYLAIWLTLFTVMFLYRRRLTRIPQDAPSLPAAADK